MSTENQEDRNRLKELFDIPSIDNSVELIEQKFPFLDETVAEVNRAKDAIPDSSRVSSYRFGVSGTEIEVNSINPDRPGDIHLDFVQSFPIDVSLRMLDDPESLEGQIVVENGNCSCTVSYDPYSSTFTVGEVLGPKYSTDGTRREEYAGEIVQALEDEGLKVETDFQEY